MDFRLIDMLEDSPGRTECSGFRVIILGNPAAKRMGVQIYESSTRRG
jgi:hypothetical protein